jgi:hypothetical protein
MDGPRLKAFVINTSASSDEGQAHVHAPYLDTVQRRADDLNVGVRIEIEEGYTAEDAFFAIMAAAEKLEREGLWDYSNPVDRARYFNRN